MLDHPNILPLYGYAEEDKRFQPLGALVSPWCHFGNASDYLSQNENQLDEFHRVDLWKGVIRGVQYLHEYHPGIVHGDLKPANVLIDNSGNPKICDFGLVRLFMESGQSGFTTTSDHTGTVRYLSPELVTGELTSMASDIYALGCIGLEFVFSILPYHRRQNSLPVNILLDIRDGKPPAERPEDLDGYLENKWEMIESCFHRDPSRRPSASDLLFMESREEATESSEIPSSLPVSQPDDGDRGEIGKYSSTPGLDFLPSQQPIKRSFLPLSPILICTAPGCTKPRWQDVQGNYMLFCGRRCRDANAHPKSNRPAPATTREGNGGSTNTTRQSDASASGSSPFTYALATAPVWPISESKACIICKTSPYDATIASLFCGVTCIKRSEAMAPGIIEISQSHPKFADISNQFQKKWLLTTRCKPIKHIYLILISSTSKATYNEYRLKVEEEGRFLSRGRSEGNERRRFQSTTRQCTLGDAGNTQLCSHQTCELCEMIRTSGSKMRQGRFGYGIYASSISSKSESYNTNLIPSPYKVIILSRITVGRGYKTTEYTKPLTNTPPGYHSILGESDIPGSVGFDEMVVYNNNAVRLAYLIAY
ncbi:hypothetical protein FRC19_006043 [Serendipita sp. 401]|nr:hypothetical protein FRC19_006043 [Serendipita sp. 401]